MNSNEQINVTLTNSDTYAIVADGGKYVWISATPANPSLTPTASLARVFTTAEEAQGFIDRIDPDASRHAARVKATARVIPFRNKA